MVDRFKKVPVHLVQAGTKQSRYALEDLEKDKRMYITPSLRRANTFNK